MAFGTHWIPQTKSLFLALCGVYGPLPPLLTIGTEVFIRWGIIFKSRHLLMSWIIQWVYGWSQLFRIPNWNEWLINLGPKNLGPNNLGPNLGPFVAPPKTWFLKLFWNKKTAKFSNATLRLLGHQMPHWGYLGVKCQPKLLRHQMPPWGHWGIKCHLRLFGCQMPPQVIEASNATPLPSPKETQKRRNKMVLQCKKYLLNCFAKYS